MNYSKLSNYQSLQLLLHPVLLHAYVLLDEVAAAALLDGGPLSWAFLEQVVDKPLGEEAQLWRVDDLPVPLHLALRTAELPVADLVFEGRKSRQKLEGQDPHAPQVHAFVVLPNVLHLRRDVVQRSAEGLLHVVLNDCCPSEIADLHHLNHKVRTPKEQTMF